VLLVFVALFATRLFSIKYATICSQRPLENSPENIWNQRFFVSKFALRKRSLLVLSKKQMTTYRQLIFTNFCLVFGFVERLYNVTQ